jgi:hypothetical protein
MAMLDEIWNTKNNREAEGMSRLTSSGDAYATIDRSTAFDDPAPVNDDAPEIIEDIDTDDCGLTDVQVMSLLKSAHSQGVSYQTQVLQPRWNAAYLAFNNKHNSDSKYSSARWRGRTRLFRPKTRSTARKKSAEAAAALFSTSDVVIVSSQNDGDEMQRASAAVVHELLNFRLDRSAENAGIPWFMISMGSHLTAQQTGVCCSKQYWEYRTEPDGFEEIEVPLVINGQEIGMQRKSQPRLKVVRDRPRVRLYPPEDVIRDPGGAWEDQGQDSSYLILKNSMSVGEAREFLKNNPDPSALVFLDISDADLTGGAGALSDSGTAATTRRSREQNGNDRFNDTSTDPEFKIIWLHENFMRITGRDYVFWTIGAEKLVSNICLVAKAYPEQGGARPVTIGVATVEPFKIDPMAPIESWQPLQQEINDVVNLRLDTMKQSISPLTLVKRGRSVDIKAIQNRSPDSVAYVQDITDVHFDRPGDVGQAAYAEMERLNADFDDQAGNFSMGSVQTNRSLNETVGGMNLMSGAANALGEFDLRVWIETWVEPCLRQLVKLEQYYESDENVIAVAAGKAQLFQKFGLDVVTDDMLTSQVTVIVNVGLGSADPMQALQKFGQATQIAAGIVGLTMMQSVKRDAVIDEIFGKAGYKDAASRFFNKSEDQDPRLMEAQKVIQQLQEALGEAENAMKDKSAERDNKFKIAQMQTVSTLAGRKTEQPAFANQMPQAPDTGMMGQGPTDIHQMLGLTPDTSGQAMAASVSENSQALMTGLQNLADAMMQGFAHMAQAIKSNGNEQVVAAVQESADRQAASTEYLARVMAAPRQIMRGKDNLMTGVRVATV